MLTVNPTPHGSPIYTSVLGDPALSSDLWRSLGMHMYPDIHEYKTSIHIKLHLSFFHVFKKWTSCIQQIFNTLGMKKESLIEEWKCWKDRSKRPTVRQVLGKQHAQGAESVGQGKLSKMCAVAHICNPRSCEAEARKLSQTQDSAEF